jgi:hypothetical protein
VRHKLSLIQTELLSLGIRRYEEDSRAYAADVVGASAPIVTSAYTAIASSAAAGEGFVATAAELAAAAQEKYTHGVPPTIPVMLTFRELLLNTVPYHRSIAQLKLQRPQLAAVRTQFLHNDPQEKLPAAPQTSLESTPIYTELVDWLIDTVYARDQQSIQNARSFARQPASALPLDTTLPMDEVIEEFEEGK